MIGKYTEKEAVEDSQNSLLEDTDYGIIGAYINDSVEDE